MTGKCDCCGRNREFGIETFACEECRNWPDCTCRTPIVHSTDIDPPEYKSIRDSWCPVHGKDPDEEYEKMRERKWDR